MTKTAQAELPFVSLDFPGRTVLTIAEVADKLGLCEEHVCDLVDEGELAAVDASSKGASRRALRVVIESYRDFICRRLTGDARRHFLAQLPRHTLLELQAELSRLLRAA